MTATVLMDSPPGGGVGGEITGTPSGTVYTPNSNGQILAQAQDVVALLALGFFVAPTGITPGPAYNINSATAAATLSGANITGGTDVTLAMAGALSGAANLTLPTVANLVAALPNPQLGQSYKLRIINKAATQTWTVTTNTGWTLTGTMTIATGTWREFIVSLTSLTTATLQEVGTGTDS